MINELFSSMHELLDYIIEHYDDADEELQEQFCQTVQELKHSNDALMDQYVALEEKLGYFFELYRARLEDQSDVQPVSHTNDQHNERAKRADSSSMSGNMLQKEQYSNSPYVQHQQVNAANQYSYSHSATCNECDLFVAPQHEQMLDQAQGYYKLFMFDKSARILSIILAEHPECNIARIYYAMSLMHLRNWNEAQRQFQLLSVLSDFPKWLALSYNALGCIQAIKLNLNQAELLFRKAYQVYPEFEDPLKNLQCCIESPKQLALYFGSTELCCM